MTNSCNKKLDTLLISLDIFLVQNILKDQNYTFFMYFSLSDIPQILKSQVSEKRIQSIHTSFNSGGLNTASVAGYPVDLKCAVMYHGNARESRPLLSVLYFTV